MTRILLPILIVALFIAACSGDDEVFTALDMSVDVPADMVTDPDADKMARPCSRDVHCERGEVCILSTGQCGEVECMFCIEGQVCDTGASGQMSCTSSECLTPGACPQPYEEPVPCQDDQVCEVGTVCVAGSMTCERVACEFCIDAQICHDNTDGTRSCSKPE